MLDGYRFYLRKCLRNPITDEVSYHHHNQSNAHMLRYHWQRGDALRGASMKLRRASTDMPHITLATIAVVSGNSRMGIMKVPAMANLVRKVATVTNQSCFLEREFSASFEI